METYKVYVHINKINGKKYIGVTCQEIDRRWRKDGSGYKTSDYFWNAIKKHGWESFDSHVLFDGLTKKEAEQKEIELIAHHKTTDKRYGYNLSNGGTLAGKHSSETRKKMSEVRKKMPVNWRNIEKMREINKGKKYPPEFGEAISKRMKGKKLSESHVENIRNSHLGYIMPESQKKKISEGVKLALSCEEKRKRISENQKKLYEDPQYVEKIRLSRLKINKPVVLTNTGEVFDNHLKAGDFYSIQNNKILKNCQGETHSAGKSKTGEKYIWVFEDDYDCSKDYQRLYKEKQKVFMARNKTS